MAAGAFQARRRCPPRGSAGHLSRATPLLTSNSNSGPLGVTNSKSLSSRTDRPPARRALQVGLVGAGEAELLVEPVRVGGVQAPAETGPGPAVDHGFHQRGAEPLAPGASHHEHVREVGVSNAVGDRPGKAGQLAGAGLIGAHHTPGGIQLVFQVGAAPRAPPVRLPGEKGPHRVAVYPAGVVVELKAAGCVAHAPNVPARRRPDPDDPGPDVISMGPASRARMWVSSGGT